MARPKDQVGLDHALTIQAPAEKIVSAFFVPAALANWWDVAVAVTTPRVMGPYTIEWAPSDERDELLGQLGGVFHGTVMEHHKEKGFFVADAYWLPPEGEPIGPMSLIVTCTRREAQRRLVDTIRGRGPNVATNPTTGEPLPPVPFHQLHIVQTGFDPQSERWRRYYEILGTGMPMVLDRLKQYLEHGKGAWDLGAW